MNLEVLAVWLCFQIRMGRSGGKGLRVLPRCLECSLGIPQKALARFI